MEFSTPIFQTDWSASKVWQTSTEFYRGETELA